jgi:hypothetical protein
MSYTFWHCGVLIGVSDLEGASDNPRQWAGIFWPTDHGLQLFPRLAGMLSAAHALKTHIEANGLSADRMEEREVEEIIETTPAGRKVIDIGRMLSDVEMRAPDGKRLELMSIAFSDVTEVKRLSLELRVEGAENLVDLPPDAPRYIVSATLRHRLPAHRKEPAAHFRH